MKRIIAFGGSTSSTSINKQLAHYTANLLEDCELFLLDLNDFELPLFSADLEKEKGIPENANRFKECIRSSDGIIVSTAEHNGNFAAAFKNLMDWVSRLEGKIWEDKPLFLMATSPGGRGGKSVLGIAQTLFPHQGANIVASFSLPSFATHFTPENGINDAELNAEFQTQLDVFSDFVNGQD